MQLIYKEHSGINYTNYEFPYCVYGIKEPSDSYHDLYSVGFLPYTNDLTIEEEIYYLARSVRIDLESHVWKFKQKNVLNKFAPVFPNHHININLVAKEECVTDRGFINWCIDNAKNHFLAEKRLNYILSRPYLTNILKVTFGRDVLAYIYIVSESDTLIHVWFSFYDLNIKMNDFGKWVLLKTIEWSKDKGFKYYYIGTCYSIIALYKLTLSSYTSYFSGREWESNISELKKRLQVEKP